MGEVPKNRKEALAVKLSRELYPRLAKAHAPRSPVGKNCRNAFLFGGAICTLGELLRDLYARIPSISEKEAGTLCSLSLILLSVLLSGIGVFDRIAKHAGAGTLVPITGFANAVVSPAIDSRAEGLVLGVGAKIFTVAGPVLLYGTLAGALYGVIFFLLSRV